MKRALPVVIAIVLVAALLATCSRVVELTPNPDATPRFEPDGGFAFPPDSMPDAARIDAAPFDGG